MNRYSVRLLSYSLLLGLLPAILIGFVSYIIASRDMEEKVKEGNMQWLAQTQTRVEQMLKSVEKSATQLANSSLVKTAMNTSYTPSDFEAVRELSKELYNLQSGEAVITQAYLVNLERNWALNLNVLKPLDQWQNRRVFTEYAEAPRSIRWYTGIEAGGGEFTEPVETITLVHKIPLLPQTNKPKGLLVVQMAAAEINHALASSDSSNRTYILDRTGAEILGPGSKEENAPINRAVAGHLESEPEKKLGLFNLKTNGEEDAVLYRSSSYNGWTYVSAVSIGELKKETRKIAEVTLAVCTVILLIVLAAAWYGSRRMYRPIGSLLEVARGLGSSVQEPSVLPKNDELDFIRHSMQSLAVSRDRVEQQMRGQASHLKEFFVLKLFTGQLTENDFLYRSALYSFPADWKRLGVLSLQIDNLQETHYDEEDRELLLYAISNIAGEVLPSSRRLTPITIHHSQVTLVAAEEEDTEQVQRILYESAEILKKNAEEVLQLKVSIGISHPFSDLMGTVKAYGESLSALKARISLGPEIIVQYRDTETLPGADGYEYSHLKVLEERLVYAIMEMQPGSASETIRQYLDALLYKDGSLHEHHLLLLQLLSRLLQIMQDEGISLQKVMEDERTVERLLRLQTREEIIHWFESKWFNPLIQALSEKTETQYVNIADKMIKLIQDRYDQEITLESCSKLLNYHPVYISRIFKREIGIPFSDYLSDYRMKMAKVMVESTDMKISEIGEKLQYKNISSFIRSFKKIYQLTPGQYREKILKGSTE
ncbi:helix-turn-helix domain-containing protein [Paenibacillus aurantius]|uniref:Helix-turn-helix domain-containing protein n=1 Tax=Paenibacillus aurantius TaxID=2918900 RepID=A0AA96LH85_9BACL|nr:helix-turn-helix domain-containing protein [Paenibacillus aurantius]WNQ13238.1 helix-turn-helix domain-containing protein [Paenibacillus aurantius]